MQGINMYQYSQIAWRFDKTHDKDYDKTCMSLETQLPDEPEGAQLLDEPGEAQLPDKPVGPTTSTQEYKNKHITRYTYMSI